MQITLKDILTTYWPQTVLLIAGLGYLIKRIFDLRSKKIEQKQELFQQNRISVIMRFMDSYVKLQGLYRRVCQPRFNLEEMAGENFSRLVIDGAEELYSSYFYLRLYLDPLEQARYTDLATEMRSISFKIIEVLERSPP